ncbi:MAG: hypothetical protein RMH75_06775 [Archaeoglobaceae archaeon]|nr:hypothetical protein [Archaeoglobaceae archaeon]
MYHIMFFNADFAHEYAHSKALHVFSPTLISLQEYQYCGYEELPIESIFKGIFKVEVEFDGLKIKRSSSNLPEKLKEEIENIRFSRLTLDHDHYDFIYTSKLMALYEALKDFPSARIFKSAKGFHLRAELGERKSFDELLELRKRYSDDFQRIIIDRAYYENGLGFLTNFLFNGKIWNEEGQIKSYRETEIRKEELPEIEKVIANERKLKPKKIMVDGLLLEIGRDETRVRGRFSERDIEKVKETLRTEEPWVPTKEEVIEIYSKFVEPSAIKEVVVIPEMGRVIVFPSDERFSGVLIGREGRVVKKVQEILGYRVTIKTKREAFERKTKDLLDFFTS